MVKPHEFPNLLIGLARSGKFANVTVANFPRGRFCFDHGPVQPMGDRFRWHSEIPRKILREFFGGVSKSFPEALEQGVAGLL